MTTRRDFLRTTAAAAGTWAAANAFTTPAAASMQQFSGSRYIGCNQFVWLNFFRRDKRNFLQELETGIAEAAESGVDGLEVMVAGPETIEQFGPLLKEHGLGMRSIYSNLVMHTPEEAKAAEETALAAAKRAVEFGTKIYVVNPAPLRGERAELGKTDEELACQAKAMNRLGKALARMEITLAYHYHAPAFEHGAREFHHTLLNTDDDAMSLCLDAHWVFRGSGDSEAAVFDVVKLYGDRVSELHLRQSVDGIWTETFESAGDIDYVRLVAALRNLQVKPLYVLEQAAENGTPQSMSAKAAISASASHARELAG